MNRFDIGIKSLVDISNNEQIKELKEICDDNQIRLVIDDEHGKTEIVNDIFYTMITIFMDNEFLQDIIKGTISSVLAGVIINNITNFVNKILNSNIPGHKKDIIKIKSKKAKLIVAKDNISDNEISNAIQAFVQVSCKEDTNTEKIVVPGDEKIMELNDYINKYVKKEDESHEHPKNAD